MLYSPIMLLNRIKALALLTECRGDEIWSVPYCEEAGVPQPWIEQLSDAFESGFKFDRDTIYVGGEVVNQYYGVSDRDIAFKLAEFLGLDPYEATAMALGRTAEVRAIKEAIAER